MAESDVKTPLPGFEGLVTSASNQVNMTDVKEDRLRLLRLTDFAGELFGTEDLCLFLHSLVRMNGPQRIVELGTGLGISAFWMALAVKRNGFGHVWTVDDHRLFVRRNTILAEMTCFLRNEGLVSAEIITATDYYNQIAGFLGLQDSISFVKGDMDPKENNHFDHYPFSGQPIDLLFSDFRHAPNDILNILGQFLPKMSPASSIFFDSATTLWPSYMLLEQLTSQLNQGHVSQTLQDRSGVDLRLVMLNRKINLVHLTRCKERDQNGTSWLKLEPIDIVPHPRTRMRGF
jgi:Methyltransferase domain